MKEIQLFCGNAVDVLATLPYSSVDCTVTSPPYFRLRKYNHPKEIGQESLLAEYLVKLKKVFAEVYRVTKPTGVFFLNMGDTYFNGQQLRVPFRVLDECCIATGWKLRQVLIYQKASPIPESVKDRFTQSHEYIFFLVKSTDYYFDMSLIQEPATCAGQTRGGSKRRYEQNAAGMDNKVYDTRNPRSVLLVRQQYTQPPGSTLKHHAVFPEELITPFITAGCPQDGTVLDPFCGSGTTLAVAYRQRKKAIGIDVIQDYIDDVHRRLDVIQR